MQPDVLSFYRFYESPLGLATAGAISNMIQKYTPLLTGKRVIGQGYCLPYLDKLKEVGALPAAFMPAAQGVCHWPDNRKPLCALVDCYDMPLADSSIDLVLLVHSLEHADRPASLLREVWRVLVPGGRVMIVVPNRRRIWSALETTPFGFGRPYSKGQLYHLMEEQMLPPRAWDTALMQPPTGPGFLAKSMRYTESPIRVLGKNLGGALMVVADKQMYGAIPTGRRATRAVPATNAS